MNEAVYIGFVDEGKDKKNRPGCVVVRLFTKDGKRWHRRALRLGEVVYPDERRHPPGEGLMVSEGHRTLYVAGQDGYIAFNCYINNRYGIMLVRPDDRRSFLPLEEPPGKYIAQMDFSADTSTLVLVYANRKPANTTEYGKPTSDILWEYVTQFLRWDKQRFYVMDTVPGWLAYADRKWATLADETQRVYSYDLMRRRLGKNEATEDGLRSLLQERNSPRVLQKIGYRQAGKRLPFVTGYNCAFSPKFRYMFEREVDDIGLPGVNSYRMTDEVFWKYKWMDAVYSPGRGIVWSMVHVEAGVFRQFQFLNEQGDFRFASPLPFTMRPRVSGQERPIQHKAGIFEVEVTRNRVHYTPFPLWETGIVKVTPQSSPAFYKNVLGNEFFLMKRATAT